MCVFNDKLVISTVGSTGPSILISKDLSAEDESARFTTIATQADLFNYPAFRYCDSIYGGSIWDMIEYNGHLYVSICTGKPENMKDEYTMQSFAIVRGDEDEDGKFSWTSLVGNQENDGAKYCFGIDPERTRAGAANLAVYNGKLYIGEYNDEEIALENILFNKNATNEDGTKKFGLDFEFINRNLEQSVNLYRMDENEDVELVVGDEDVMFPDGGSACKDSGFGRNENQYIWKMQVHDGELLIGTFDTSSLLEPFGQFTNGDILCMSKKEWESQIAYNKVLVEKLLNTYLGGSSISTYILGKLKKAYEAIETALEEIGMSLDTTNLSAFLANYKELVTRFNAFIEKLKSLNLFVVASAVENAFCNIINSEFVRKLEGAIKCMDYMSVAERGFDLYTLDDRDHIKTITIDGFGDPYNHGLRAFAETDSGLTIGTANPFYGTQIWLMKDKK